MPSDPIPTPALPRDGQGPARVPELEKAEMRLPECPAALGPALLRPMPLVLSDHSSIADPYAYYERLRERGPVVPVFDSLYAGRMFAVLDYHVAEAALKDPRLDSNVTRTSRAKFVGREREPVESFPSSAVGVMERFVVFRDGNPHQAVRNFFSESFTREAAQTAAADIRILVHELLDRAMCSGNSFCLVDRIARPLPLTVITRQLGLPGLDQIFSAEDIEKIARGTISVCPSSADFEAASVLLREKTPELLGLLKGAPEGRAMLAKWTPHTELTQHSLLSNLVFFLIAGHETTTNLICNMVAALIEHPPAWQMLKARIMPASAAVKETLRYDSPVQNVLRVATGDLELGGVSIEAGDRVAVLLGAANRDPRRFSNPADFDILRSSQYGLAFGAGKHACPGYYLAQVEATIFLEELLARAETISVLPDAPPQRRNNPTLRGFSSFPLKFN